MDVTPEKMIASLQQTIGEQAVLLAMSRVHISALEEQIVDMSSRLLKKDVEESGNNVDSS